MSWNLFFGMWLPTPDPSQEGNRTRAFDGRMTSCLIPSWEGSGVGLVLRLATSFRRWLVLLCTLLAVSGQAVEEWRTITASGSRFMALEVFVDAGGAPLAAYQLTVKATQGQVKIAGIEGGEAVAFAEPPHYDPKALQKDIVILAAFSTNAPGQLPHGRTRVATLHLQVEGKPEPKFATTLTTAGTVDGTQITATADVKERKTE